MASCSGTGDNFCNGQDFLLSFACGLLAPTASLSDSTYPVMFIDAFVTV